MLNTAAANTRFSQAPATIDMQRSTFDRDSTHKTTFNAGKLVPIYLDEVLPGDTFDMSTSCLVRMSTPIFPVMDDANLDIAFFYIPSRLLWTDFVHFMGEPKQAWYDDDVYLMPKLVLDPQLGDLADHFGLPVGQGECVVSALPFRAYQLIWNEYYRDQNLQDPLLINIGNSSPGGDVIEGIQDLLPVAKYHDYFTSALPSPQRGPDVLLPFSGAVPVVTGGADLERTFFGGLTFGQYVSGSAATPLTGDTPLGTSSGGVYTGQDGNFDPAGSAVVPTNLIVNADDIQVTINNLRQAMMLQHMYEADARGGARYRELMAQHFRVRIPDSTVQIPELLCQHQIPISINQVVQQSATDDVSPQGNTAAFSKTVSRNESFNKSFTEHGYIIGLACVRTNHSYSQGINRLWTRESRFDYYWPALAHLGEQPVLNQEIYYAHDDDMNEQVFGYQEAWAEYRYKPNIITGAMRPGIPGSLDVWHYGDYYASRPYLSEDWIKETDVNINRTLAVPSELSDQFICDFYFDCKCTRAMPLYSIPGLMGHI